MLCETVSVRSSASAGVSAGLPFASVLFRLVGSLRLARSSSKDALEVYTLQMLSMQGTRRMTTLAQALGVSQPGMTQLVDRLEERGEVRRVRDAVDGRVVLVEIESAGRQRLAELVAEAGDLISTMLDQLSESDRRQITESLAALDALATVEVPTVAGADTDARVRRSADGGLR